MTTFTTEDRLSAGTSLQDRITTWIRDYAVRANIKSLVVGISGGIDSAVVSALCARTGLNVFAVTMPIRQRPDLHDLSMRQGFWLAQNFDNIRHEIIDLTSIFDGSQLLGLHFMNLFSSIVALAWLTNDLLFNRPLFGCLSCEKEVFLQSPSLT